MKYNVVVKADALSERYKIVEADNFEVVDGIVVFYIGNTYHGSKKNIAAFENVRSITVIKDD